MTLEETLKNLLEQPDKQFTAREVTEMLRQLGDRQLDSPDLVARSFDEAIRRLRDFRGRSVSADAS